LDVRFAWAAACSVASSSASVAESNTKA
jgi:hypothetical protein